MPLYNQFNMPRNEKLSIWLDDEREAPEGWVHVKNPWDLLKIIDDPEAGQKITRISLDWYLGAGIENGEKVAERICDRIRSNPNFLPVLKEVFAHSSDRDKARAMAIRINDELEAAGRDVRVRMLRPQTKTGDQTHDKYRYGGLNL